LISKDIYQQIVNALRRSRGNVSSAAKILSISRKEILDYIESDESLREVLFHEEESLKDIVEQCWFSLMLSDKTDPKLKSNMLKHTLSTKCKDRGWGITTEQNVNLSPPIHIDSVYTRSHNEKNIQKSNKNEQLKLNIQDIEQQTDEQTG
jgi:hypothetical protein